MQKKNVKNKWISSSLFPLDAKFAWLKTESPLPIVLVENGKKIVTGENIDKYSASSSSQHHSQQQQQHCSGGDSKYARNKSSSVNNCYLSGSSNGHQQSQYQQQKPLSISTNNFSPASNSFSSDNNKTLYKSSSHNINTGGTCDKNYQQQATQQQQQQLYASSNKNGNSASYLSQSTPSTHFDFEHIFSDPNESQSHNLNKNQSYNTTASGSTRSSRSYQTNQQAANSDQFQGSFSCANPHTLILFDFDLSLLDGERFSFKLWSSSGLSAFQQDLRIWELWNNF